MTGRRNILISTLLVSLRVGVGVAVFGQSGQGQPGPGSAVPVLPPENPLRSRLQALLPSQGMSAQLMQSQSYVSVVDFQQRVVQSGGDLKVLANVLGQARQGDIPSYDERLGISRAEFQRYLIFRSTLEPSGKMVRLTLSREGNKLVFGEVPGASILKGLHIDTNTGELSTQEGFSARPHPVQISAVQDSTGLGASSGLAWDVKGSNPKTQNALQGHLSLLLFSGGQVLLSYNRVSIQKGRISEDSLNLTFRK